MQGIHEWLSQGDLFSNLPIIEATYDDGDVQVSVNHGPSMLCTHDCDLDKHTNSGHSKLKSIHFVPLRSVSALNQGQQAHLVANPGSLNPARIFHLGTLDGLGDTICDLGEMYSLPAKFLSPELREFPDGDASSLSLVATQNDTRLGQIDEQQLILLRKKLMAFWTRLEAIPSES